jgi:hypothetical protein
MGLAPGGDGVLRSCGNAAKQGDSVRAHEALQMQVDLRAKVATPEYQKVIDTYLCSAAFKADNRDFFGVNVFDHPGIEAYRSLGLGREWGELEALVLNDASTYIVSESMNALIKRASDDLNDDMVLEEWMLPSPTGFLVFEHPFPYQEFDGETLWAKAVSWAQVTFDKGMLGEPIAPREGRPAKGVVVNWYVDITDVRSHSPEDTKFYTDMAARLLGRLSMQHRQEIRFGETLGKMRAPEYSFQESDAALGPVKNIMTVWFMMQQTITETVRETFSEKNARRWNKKGVKDPSVRVIALRRRTLNQSGKDGLDSDRERANREYRHRWYVKGHWKMQPYGPKRSLRRPLYVHPYIAGPEDKPLLDKKSKVYKLSR